MPVHGTNTTITVDAQAFTAYTMSSSLDTTASTDDTTPYGVDHTTSVVGPRTHTLQMSGSHDATPDSALWGMFDGATVAFSYSPDGTITYSGNGFLTNKRVESSSTGKVSWSGTLQASGAVSRA